MSTQILGWRSDHAMWEHKLWALSLYYKQLTHKEWMQDSLTGMEADLQQVCCSQNWKTTPTHPRWRQNTKNCWDFVQIDAYFHGLSWSEFTRVRVGPCLTRRQSDVTRKGFIQKTGKGCCFFFFFFSFFREIRMSQHTDPLTHTSTPGDTGRKNKGSNFKMCLYFYIAVTRTFIPVEKGKGRSRKATPFTHAPLLLFPLPK